MSEQSTVLVSRVRIDGGTQPRAAISDQTVSDYAEAIYAGDVLPPVDVFFDGVEYWLADGFHRYLAMQRLGEEYIRATLHTGTRRDAVLFSVGVNAGHGLQRTNEDKRKSVMTLMSDAEWSKWSNREIARRCGVNPSLADNIRNSLTAVKRQLDPQVSGAVIRTYTKRGAEETMHVDKIGRKKEAEQLYESRKSAAVEGAAVGLLKRLPRKSDAAIVENTVQAMRGILSAFGTVDPAPLSDHPDVEEWRAVISETIGVLRSFNKRLERRAV